MPTANRITITTIAAVTPSMVTGGRRAAIKMVRAEVGYNIAVADPE